MIRWILIGTALQSAMVLSGHWNATVAQLFAPLGIGISLVVGLMWARTQARNYGHAIGGGAVVGGACASIGIFLSLLLGDVGPVILAFGTLSSAVGGAVGGLGGAALRPALVEGS